MKPLTVTAALAKPPACDQPLYLDGLLLFALGAEMGCAHPSGMVEPEAVYAAAEGGEMPLARVDTPAGWWWCASAAHLVGPERREHLVRRVALDAYARLTDRGSVGHKAGPDKMLRMPFFYRPSMLSLAWTCVGDLDRVTELLARVPSVGRHTTHGWGWVRSWTVHEGGPGPSAYATDLRLRHLPADVDPDVSGVSRWTSRRMPLRPPYYRRTEGVPCIQIA